MVAQRTGLPLASPVFESGSDIYWTAISIVLHLIAVLVSYLLLALAGMKAT